MRQLKDMETIGVNELHQHVSAALRRVARGETIGVTERGRLVAILCPPSHAVGSAALVASGRVQLARRPTSELEEPVSTEKTTAEVLDEMRSGR